MKKEHGSPYAHVLKSTVALYAKKTLYLGEGNCF